MQRRHLEIECKIERGIDLYRRHTIAKYQKTKAELASFVNKKRKIQDGFKKLLLNIEHHFLANA
jgi:hypothetical protein